MSALLRHSSRSYSAYAAVHGYDVEVSPIDDVGADDEVVRRRARWTKIDLLLSALRGYDLVVWIDADAMFCRFDRDIADDVPPDCFQALTLEVFPTRTNPNTGVWLLRGGEAALAFLRTVRAMRPIVHSWSDQAGVCAALGWSLGDYHGHGAAPVRSSPFLPGTAWLPPEWNDVGALSAGARVKHFAGLPLHERARRMGDEWRRLRRLGAVPCPLQDGPDVADGRTGAQRGQARG